LISDQYGISDQFPFYINLYVNNNIPHKIDV
jgi:hypothetical protein